METSQIIENQPIETILERVREAGGDIQLRSAQHGEVQGWACDMNYAPGEIATTELENAPEILRMLIHQHRQTDPENPDHNHAVQVQVFDTELDRGVKRCAEAFFAAYAASLVYID